MMLREGKIYMPEGDLRREIIATPRHSTRGAWRKVEDNRVGQ